MSVYIVLQLNYFCVEKQRKITKNRGEMRGSHAFSIEFPWNHMTLRKAVTQPSELTVLLPTKGTFWA